MKQQAGHPTKRGSTWKMVMQKSSYTDFWVVSPRVSADQPRQMFGEREAGKTEDF